MLIKSIHLDPFSWYPRLFGWFWTLKKFGIWELQNWKNYSSYTLRNALHTSLRAWNAAKNYELYYWLTIIIYSITITIIISIIWFLLLCVIYHLLSIMYYWHSCYDCLLLCTIIMIHYLAVLSLFTFSSLVLLFLFSYLKNWFWGPLELSDPQDCFRFQAGGLRSPQFNKNPTCQLVAILKFPAVQWEKSRLGEVLSPSPKSYVPFAHPMAASCRSMKISYGKWWPDAEICLYNMRIVIYRTTM